MRCSSRSGCVFDGNGQPVAGFPDSFRVDTPPCYLCLCEPLDTCGYFLVPPPAMIVESVCLETDASGVATASTFRTNDELVSVFGGIGWNREVAG